MSIKNCKGLNKKNWIDQDFFKTIPRSLLLRNVGGDVSLRSFSKCLNENCMQTNQQEFTKCYT